MEKVFCVAEKKEQANQIALALGLNLINNAYVGEYKDKYLVLVWCTGHLLEMIEPMAMKDRVVDWKEPGKNLPLPRVSDIPLGVKQSKDDQYKKRYRSIQDCLKRHDDFSSIICCTDPDDEGVVIFYNLINYLKLSKMPLYHAVLDKSLSQRDVCDAFDNLKKFDIRMFYKGKYRAYSDWLYMFYTVGFTAFMRKKFGSIDRAVIGRVQTIILKLVDIQTDLNNNFDEYPYYLPKILMKGKHSHHKIAFLPKLTKEDSINYSNQAYSEEELFPKIKKLIVNNTLDVQGTIGRKSSNPNKICNLANLQQGLSQQDISGEDTIRLADELRLKGFCTYARTDHNELPISMREPDTIKALLKAAAAFEGMEDWASELQKDEHIERILAKKSLWRDGGMEHHGIIITPEVLRKGEVSEEAVRVYKFILESMLASFSDSLIYDQASLVIKVDDLDYQCILKSVVSPGWTTWLRKNVDTDSYVDSEVFALLKEDLSNQANFKFFGLDLEQKKASKPKLYDEGSLINILSKPYLVFAMKDEEKQILKKHEGIGRPSTRSSIIERLINYEYIEKNKKNFKSTDLGKLILGSCPSRLYKVALTAEWIKTKEKFLEYNSVEDAYNYFLDACERQRLLAEEFLRDWDKEMESLPNPERNGRYEKKTKMKFSKSKKGKKGKSSKSKKAFDLT